MRKSVILKLLTIFFVATYILVLAIYFFVAGGILPAWFSCACFLIGIWSLTKAVFFHLDSNFWLGICLLFVACIGFLDVLGLLEQQNLAIFYVLAPIYASVFTGGFYQNLTHYKISFALLLEDFLILLYTCKIISTMAFVISTCILASCFIGGIYVFRRKKRLQQKGSRQKNQ